jgi:hypothetical protein
MCWWLHFFYSLISNTAGQKQINFNLLRDSSISVVAGGQTLFSLPVFAQTAEVNAALAICDTTVTAGTHSYTLVCKM